MSFRAFDDRLLLDIVFAFRNVVNQLLYNTDRLLYLLDTKVIAVILDFNVGIFLYTALSAIGVIGVFIAGWSSNNKYGVVSAMRGAVQMISYEMSLGLCLITAHLRGFR